MRCVTRIMKSWRMDVSLAPLLSAKVVGAKGRLWRNAGRICGARSKTGSPWACGTETPSRSSTGLISIIDWSLTKRILRQAGSNLEGCQRVAGASFPAAAGNDRTGVVMVGTPAGVPELLARIAHLETPDEIWHPSRMQFPFSRIPGVSLADSLHPRLPAGNPPGWREKRNAKLSRETGDRFRRPTGLPTDARGHVRR